MWPSSLIKWIVAKLVFFFCEFDFYIETSSLVLHKNVEACCEWNDSARVPVILNIPQILNSPGSLYIEKLHNQSQNIIGNVS